MNLPDYSEFLKTPGMLDYIENEWQRTIHLHKAQAEVINSINSESILEIGCATGNLAQFLNGRYLGFDKNEDCVQIAANKNPDKTFKAGDIRNIRRTKNQSAQTVVAMAIMKHFGLEEWDEIMKKIISLADSYVIFDMPIAEETFDDGEKHGHHHVWMSTEDLMNRLDYLGLEVYERNDLNPVEPIFICLKK